MATPEMKGGGRSPEQHAGGQLGRVAFPMEMGSAWAVGVRPTVVLSRLHRRIARGA